MDRTRTFIVTTRTRIFTVKCSRSIKRAKYSQLHDKHLSMKYIQHRGTMWRILCRRTRWCVRTRRPWSATWRATTTRAAPTSASASRTTTLHSSRESVTYNLFYLYPHAFYPLSSGQLCILCHIKPPGNALLLWIVPGITLTPYIMCTSRYIRVIHFETLF